jgi:hypothetical protein
MSCPTSGEPSYALPRDIHPGHQSGYQWRSGPMQILATVTLPSIVSGLFGGDLLDTIEPGGL